MVDEERLLARVELLEKICGTLLLALYNARLVDREKSADLFYQLGVERPKE